MSGVPLAVVVLGNHLLAFHGMELHDRPVLPLAQASSTSWLTAALAQRETILLDHAHCEKKAASTAMSFVFRHPERPGLAQAMSRVAREELVHFERVLGELSRRGIEFRRLAPSRYGEALHAHVRRAQPQKLVDQLLVSALIEARSSERFALLAERTDDAGLAGLYRELGPAEERHTELYLELAAEVAPRVDVEARWGELAEREAEIIARPGEPVRLHAG
jgi:tRNA-(ms[2]io[6]A)-hydroxylase